MTYPRPTDSLATERDHRDDARAAGAYDDTTRYHAALGGWEDEPAAWEVADLEEDGW